jgi:multisubunit Na+/H+ antiporter MnhB subunit
MNSEETRSFEAVTAIMMVLWIVIVAMFLSNLINFLTSIEYAAPITLEKHPFFIWTYRGLDTLTQVFLLLATALGVTALLREDEGPGVEEEPVVEGEEG